jgi:5-formyltetrahydrofolate cyclo-ligase
MDKKTLRKELLAQREALYDPAEDQRVVRRLLNWPLYAASRGLLVTVSFGSEIDTAPVITDALDRDKTLCVPLCRPADHSLILSRLLHYPGDLVPGAMGILEPKPDCVRPLPVEALDLVVVPGLAFSQDGHRLGFGGGYYDRLLARLPADCVTVGLCRAAMMREDLPLEPHDLPVAWVITEEHVIHCK